MMKLNKAVLAIVLLALAGPAFGAAGDTVSNIYKLAFGPFTTLIIAIGFLAALVAWGTGRKKAGILLLAGFMFLGVVKQSVISQIGGGGWLMAPSGATIGAGTGFPTYGNAGQSVAWIPGSELTLGYAAEWGTIGLFYCHALLTGLFSMGVIALVALIGAWRTYYMLTVREQAGSMMGYLVTILLVGGICIMPVVQFNTVPSNNSKGIPNPTYVIKSIAGTNSLLNSIADSTAVNVPILPALVVIAGYDLATKVGETINPSPPSGYPGTVYKAALAAGLSSDQIKEYQEYAAHCGAAARGVFENDSRLDNAPISNSKPGAVNFGAKGSSGSPIANDVLTRVRMGREKMETGSVVPGQLHALSRFGDWMYLGVPLDGYTFNDDEEQRNMTYYSRSLDAATGDRNTVYYIPGLPSVGNAVDPIRLMRGDYAAIGGVRESLGAGYYPPIRELDNSHRVNYPIYKRPFGDWARESGGANPRTVERPRGNATIRVCSMPDGEPGSAHETVNMGTATVSNDTSMMSWYLVGLTPMDGATTYDFIDYASDVRTRLLKRYVGAGGYDLCSSISGTPENKDWWGCLVTGGFSNINAGNNGYQVALDTSQWFFVDGRVNYLDSDGVTKIATTPADYLVRKTTVPLWPDYSGGYKDAMIPTRLGAGTDLRTPDFTNTGWVHSALDVMFMAPGIYNEISGTSHSGTSSQLAAESAGLSIWDIFVKKPGEIIKGLIKLIFEGIRYLVQMLWPHIQGIVIALLLGIAYPVAATVALWPGNWRYLMDWSLAMLWVIAWVVPMALGYSLINNTALNEYASIMGSSGPAFGGGIVTTMVGTALVLMAPAITSMLFSLTFSSYASMASSIAGTAFQVVGMAAAIVGAAAGLGAGALVGAMGAAGAAKAATAGASAASSAASGAGGAGASGGVGGATNSILNRGMAGLKSGAQAGSMASRGIQAGMGVVSTLAGGGPAGQVAHGAHAGHHLSEAGTAAAVETAAAGGAVASRIGARALTSMTGADAGTKTGRLANTLAGDASQGLHRTIAGGAMESLGGSGGGMFDVGGDSKTQGALFSRQASNAQSVYENEVREGRPNSPEARGALAASAAASRAAAAHSNRTGDSVGAAEHLRRSADAEVASFLSNGGDYDRARGSVQMAANAGYEAERSSTMKGDNSGALAGREIQAESKAQQARVALKQLERVQQSVPAGQQPSHSTRETIEGLRSEAITASGEAMRGYDTAFSGRKEMAQTFSADSLGTRQRVENIAAMTSLATQAREAHAIYRGVGGQEFTSAAPGPAILSDSNVETGLNEAAIGGGKTARTFAEAAYSTMQSEGRPAGSLAPQWKNVQIAANQEGHETIGRLASTLSQRQEKADTMTSVSRVASISHEMERTVAKSTDSPTASGVRMFGGVAPSKSMNINPGKTEAPEVVLPKLASEPDPVRENTDA